MSRPVSRRPCRYCGRLVPEYQEDAGGCRWCVAPRVEAAMEVQRPAFDGELVAVPQPTQTTRPNRALARLAVSLMGL